MSSSDPYSNSRRANFVDRFRDVNGNIDYDLPVAIGFLAGLCIVGLLGFMGVTVTFGVAMAGLLTPIVPSLGLAFFLGRESHRENKRYRGKS